MQQIKWSHSSLKQFETCQRQYHEIKVLKKWPFEQGEQALYGEQLHLAAELYVKNGTPIPPQFAFIKPVIDALLTKKGEKLAEHEMALDEQLNVVTWDSPKVWVRGIADLLVIDDEQGYVVDYKTGSNRYPDPKQLQLMALMAFAHFPQLENVRAGLLFVMHEHFVTSEYSREKMDEYWADFYWNLERLRLSYENDSWQMNPGPLCGWCPVRTCEHHKER